MINIDALKHKVLALAMRGHLSSSLPSDSSVEQLYNEILEIKNDLIKQNLIRKDTKLEDVVNPDNEIPLHWKWVRFGKIITLQSGQDLKRNEYNDCNNGVPYMTGASNFCEDGSLIVNRWTETPKSIAKCGDILISVKGTVGKIAILNEDEVHIARQIMGVHTYKLNLSFAKYYIESEIDKIKAASKGLIPGIERNDILNMCFPLPPIEEQERIADKLTNIFNLLDTIDELQSAYASDLEVLKSKIIDAGIQGKLTEQLPENGNAEDLYATIQEEIDEEEKILEIPDNWQWIKLGWVMDIERGGSPRPIKAFMTDSEDGINWIKIGDVAKDGKYITQTKEKIKPDGEKKSRKVVPGDFLLTNSMSFGRPYISKIHGCIHDGWLLLRNSKDVFDLDYLYYLLSSKYAYNQFCKKASGATVDNLNKDKVASAVVPLPPINEQTRIANVIEQTLALIN